MMLVDLKNYRLGEKDSHSRLRMALFSLAAWTTIGVVFAMPGLESTKTWLPLLRSLADWWAWGLLTPAIVAIDRRLPIALNKVGTRLAAHIALGLPAAIVYSYVSALLETMMGVMALPVAVSYAPLQETLKGGFLWDVLVYLLIVGGWQAIQYSQDYVASQWSAIFRKPV
jgi:two-component system LytT family sensor kinase